MRNPKDESPLQQPEMPPQKNHGNARDDRGQEHLADNKQRRKPLPNILV